MNGAYALFGFTFTFTESVKPVRHHTNCLKKYFFKKIYNNNNNNNNNSNNNKIHTYISLTCLVWIAFSLNTASDGDNTTSAGSWFHSLEVHGKKENLRAFLELKGVSGIYTHDCSHFASIQWFQPIVYIQILQTYIDIHFLS